MSAWSSATGKAQQSYADRLRQASKSNAPAKQDSPASNSSRDAPREVAKASLSIASLARPSVPSRRLSSASSASASAASGSAPRPSAAPSENKAGSPSGVEASATPQSSTGSTVNVWEARRKQLAEREAEKERERQASLAQQSKASPAAAATASSSAGAAASKAKQTAAGPRKANERHSKGSTSSSQSERKSNNQPHPSSTRPSNTVPIATSTTDKAGAASQTSNADSAAPVSEKADTAAEQGRATGTTPQEDTSGQARESAGSKRRARQSEVAERTPASSAEKALQQPDQAAKAPAAAQTAAAQVPPSAALSVQPAATPSVTHDEAPTSPGTVASAIEEVLKNGSGAHGAQAEDDDAWLARIHLLNGGQNMPKFGGFGPNGAAAQTDDEAEKQAAKKAERAVAAAWGAGKNVWSKSQQQQQSQQASHQDANKNDASAAISSGDAAKDSNPADGASVQAGTAPASVLVNGNHSPSREAGNVTATGKAKTAATKSGSPDAKNDVGPGKKQTQGKSSAGKNIKGAGAQQQKVAATSVPSFEDVSNWPSPLDAGKKTGEKPRASVGSGDHDHQDAGKHIQPGTQKSLKETLDELQVRLAPGANPQQAGATAGGAKKGKQQWVPILPEITHASHNAPGAKAGRAASDAKQGKGANKQQQQQQQQQRKEGNKGAGQSQQAGQGGKKDAANKAKDKSSQAKEGAGGASAGAKAAEARGKKESPAQPTSQDQKEGAGVSSEANARLDPSHPATVAAESQAATSQSQSVDSKKSVSIEPDSASASNEEKQTNSTPASARGESPTKQSQQARTHLRPLPNGISRPNGVVPHRSGASTGTGTPITNRSSPRGSIVSSPNVHPLSRTAPPHGDIIQPPPVFYGPSGAATPMHANNSSTTWLPYTTPFTRPIPYMFDTTQQTGAPLPPAPLGQLLTQIEFYFSQHNLQGDFFLRGKMDAQGWVDMGVLAGFKRVQAITTDVGTVKEALLYSAVLDVDGWRVRRRFGWEMYVLPATDTAVNGDKTAKDEVEQTTKDDGEEKAEGEDEEEALGVVAASGFGGALEA